MSFSNMLKVLQSEDENKIVWIKVGAFYIATGKDAVYLSEKLGLKCVCFKKQICKVGIPISKIEEYIKKLEKLNLGYIVYEFNDKKEELKVKYEREGKYHNIKSENRNCIVCKTIEEYTKDKYMLAIRKMFKEGKS